MNCKLCHRQYSNDKDTLPRVLINCGHTLCQYCIQKTFPDRQLTCPQCNEISYGISFHQYPINATLLSLLKQQAICKLHNQKLQAYCQKDNQLLCLNCVIGTQHKTHKISSVSQKVNRDRNILKQCMKQIEDSCSQIQSFINITQQNVQRLQNQYKDYLLEIGLFFNNIRQNIKQIQQNCINKAKYQYQLIMQKYKKAITQMSQKNQFMNQLRLMYDQIMYLPNIQYLHQDNKRLFIMENCKVKKCKIQPIKLIFNKINIFHDIINSIQQMIMYQKKLQNQISTNTPILKPKKSNRTKQPTILQVNLNQQYKKHFKSTIETNNNSNNNNNQLTNTNFITGASTNNLASNQTSKPKIKPTQKNKHIPSTQLTKTPKKQKSIKKQPIAISSNSQSDKNHTNTHNNNINNSFQSQCLPISMINSFMQSNLSSQSISLRGSQADFTMITYQHKLYHFGGFNDSSVQYSKIDDPKINKIISNANIQRSKAQCVIIPNYSIDKCLIFGGKLSTDQKLDTFIQYDIQSNKWCNSLYKLSQAKSGFGSTVKQNKLYIAGGSNNTRSLKSFQQYKITPKSMIKTDLPNMNYYRDQLGLVCGFDGYIYACGGINQSGSVLSSCQRYNQSKGRWEIIASMNKARRSFTLVSLPHGIYAIGGYDGMEYLKQVQLYDFTAEKWIIVASMNQPRFAHTAVVTPDLQNIIVSGGFYKKPLKSTQIFDIINQKWSQGPPLQSQRFLHCSLITNF